MFGFDAQQRVQEALRRIDQLLVADLELEEQIQKQAVEFRDMLYGAFQYFERESMHSKALFVQCKRLEANQMQVQSKGRPACILALDSEPAYDRKTQPAGEPGSEPQPNSIELAARLFAVMVPPQVGLLRYYTIFADGSWKKTTFALGQGGVHAQSVMLQRFSPDTLIMEGTDLLSQLCLAHPVWAGLAATAESFSLETLRDRSKVKLHPTGLGIPRNR